MRKMKKDLKKDLEIPEVVEQKIQNAYKEIGQGKVRMKKQDNGKQKSRKVWVAAAVAVIAVSGSGLYANPVWIIFPAAHSPIRRPFSTCL